MTVNRNENEILTRVVKAVWRSIEATDTSDVGISIRTFY